MVKKIGACLALCAAISVGTIRAQELSESFREEHFPHHESMADVAQKVLGFGGLFLDNDGTRLNVYLLEPRTKDAAVAAIAEVFGVDFLQKYGPRVPSERCSYTAR